MTWALDPGVSFLNHGSFGACPVPVLAYQRELQDRIEAEPVRFFTRTYETLWDEARQALAQFVDCDVEGLVSVPNATTGVNTVLRSLELASGDELVITSQTYNAVRNAAELIAASRGAQVVVAGIPFPVDSNATIEAAVMAAVTERTRCVVLDHVASPTGLVLPVEALIPGLQERGVRVLVDGAHAPGMVDLSLRRIRPDYYTGNGHKWLCAPKGAGFLYVDPAWRASIHPLVISHGARMTRHDRSRFLLEFGWTGTHDPSAFLTLPEAIRHMGALCAGGWPELRAQNHALAVLARGLLLDALDIAPPCPDELFASMAAVPLPDAEGPEPDRDGGIDPLQSSLLERHSIEVPVIPWPRRPRRLLRLSAQFYNEISQYERLARVLRALLH